MWLVALTACLALTATVTQAQRNQVRDRAMGPYKVGFENLRAEAWDKAAASFAEAIEIDPTFEMAYYMLGRTNINRKKYAEAATALAKCRDLYVARAGRQFTNAQEAQRYRRDRLSEIDEVIRGYQGGPATGQTAEALRQLNEQRRQINDAIQQGMNVTIDASVPAYVWLSLGSAYFRMGRMPDAERAYKATVEVDPKSGEAHNNLAVVYLTTGRIPDAERAVQAAEKAGFRVNQGLKDEIRAAKQKTND
jgi:tetratricopeptide (TPR) repeat protein